MAGGVIAIAPQQHNHQNNCRTTTRGWTVRCSTADDDRLMKKRLTTTTADDQDDVDRTGVGGFGEFEADDQTLLTGMANRRRVSRETGLGPSFRDGREGSRELEPLGLTRRLQTKAAGRPGPLPRETTSDYHAEAYVAGAGDDFGDGSVAPHLSTRAWSNCLMKVHGLHFLVF